MQVSHKPLGNQVTFDIINPFRGAYRVNGRLTQVSGLRALKMQGSAFGDTALHGAMNARLEKGDLGLAVE